MTTEFTCDEGSDDLHLLATADINPLVTDPLYLACMAKISIFRIKGIIEKFLFEHRTYESVDDESHSSVISQKATGNKTRALMG